ncbi:MAG TPA: MOSC domain-containing protein [Marmoricola sp.]|jgi:MOSC domain-containing protein YiiM|nr:MOSC domain-containing protein [Marmoricola sp.]
MSEFVTPSRVLSVNVGRPRERSWAGIGRTSIDKRPVTGPVAARLLGLEGDQVSDTRHHGGVDQAVYAFAREDLDWWGRELGTTLRNGHFGENLTTVGIDVNAAEVGERWRIGTALLEVASVRIPCNDFKGWLAHEGLDNRAWVKRFAARQRPGPYLRVVEPGVVQAGDPILVEDRPGHGVTVSTMFRALTSEPRLLPDLLRVDGLVLEARRRAERYAAARAFTAEALPEPAR